MRYFSLVAIAAALLMLPAASFGSPVRHYHKHHSYRRHHHRRLSRSHPAHIDDESRITVPHMVMLHDPAVLGIPAPPPPVAAAPPPPPPAAPATRGAAPSSVNPDAHGDPHQGLDSSQKPAATSVSTGGQ